MKKLTIVTINKNNLNGLKETASSVIKQRNTDFEWIVVDGMSIDGSIEYIKSISSFIDLYIIENDSGIYHAMNKGVNLSSGKYLLFLNSGDVLVDGLFNDGLIDGLSKDLEYGDCLIKTRTGFLTAKQPDVLSFQSFYAGCICHQAAFVRRDLHIKYPFDEKLKLASCRRFFLDIIVFGNASYHYLGRPIAVYDTGGMSSLHKDKLVEEQSKYITSYLPQMVLYDMERLRHYDIYAKNSNLFALIMRIHPFSGRRRFFESIVIKLSKIIFPL